jgi:hypothetical protein
MGSSSNVDATRIAARIQDLSSEPVLLLRINGEMRVAASARMSPEASNLFFRTVLRDQNTSAGQPDYLTYLLPIVRQLPKGRHVSSRDCRSIQHFIDGSFIALVVERAVED